MRLNLVNCESLLVVVLNHGGHEMEEVFGDRGELEAVLLSNHCPILFVLLLLDVLLQVVV